MARTKRKANPLVPELTPATSTARVYKAAGYVRLSVEDGGKPGADTLEGQKALIGGYIAEQADMQLVGLFCDNGRSGTDFARPQFEKLMDLVRKGQIDCIVVKDLSRFGRNYKENGNYLERIFPFLGVRFIAINDNFDTLTAERTQDGYIVPLKNLINEVYSKDISRKSGSALETKQLKGEFIGAWAPYGYSKDPENKNHLIVNPDTAPIVRQIFAWRKERISVVQIGRRLNDAGIPSPSAYLYLTGAVKTEKYKDVLWHTQIIKSLLAHPVYLGHMVQGRKKQSFYEGKAQIYVPESEWKIVRHTHEAIIDQETFDTVYTCRSVGLGTGYGCTSEGIPQSDIHDAVITLIRTYAQYSVDLERLQSLQNERRRATQKQVKKDLAVLQSRRAQLEKAMQDLYEKLIDGSISRESYLSQKQSINIQMQELEEQTAAMQSAAREPDANGQSILEKYREYAQLQELTADIAKELVRNVVVYPGGRLDINLNYRDELEAMLKEAEAPIDAP